MQKHSECVFLGKIAAVERNGANLVLRFVGEPRKRSTCHGTVTFTSVGQISSIDGRSSRTDYRLEADYPGCSLDSLWFDQGVAYLTILKHEDHDANPVMNKVVCEKVVVVTHLSILSTFFQAFGR